MTIWIREGKGRNPVLMSFFFFFLFLASQSGWAKQKKK